MEWESEKVKGIVHTLCAEALEHFRSYLIFHKDEYLSSDYI